MFHLDPKSASEEDTESLKQIYWSYENKILFKLNGMENKKHETACAGKERNYKLDDKIGWCNCRTRQDEIHEWEDFILENFGKSIGEIVWIIPQNVLSRVSV